MKKLLLLFALLSVTGFCYAQTDYPEVVPPPPSVASLMRFEEVPIDYYTGQPNISIPLGNVSIDKNLSYGIGLSYNTQAIRVDERSGWLGTGFAMSTGGTISRTIKGLPDELNHSAKGKGIFHNEYLNFTNLDPFQKAEFLWKSANGKGGEKLDADHDIYQYSYLGGSGRFIIVKEGAILKAVITESDTNEKINLEYDLSSFVITKFEIIDTKGYVYSFVEHNKNRITSVSISTSQFGGSASATGDYMGTDDVPNAWYLKDIKLPSGIIVCSFTYNNIVQENYHTPYSSTRNNLASTVYYGATTDVQNANKAMLMPKFVYSNQTINSTQKYVSLVTFRDSTKVKYNIDPNGHPEYGASTFNYIPGGKLSSIQILDRNGVENKKINFIYQTTANNRMFLTEIEEVYGSDVLTYTLDYLNKEELPSFDDEHQDVWGYYNGPNSTNPNFLISGALPEKATTGSISSITYPTGGKKEFVFESNSYGFEGSSPVDEKTIQDNRVLQQRLGSLSITNLDQFSPTRYLLYIDSGQKYNLTTSYTTSGNIELVEHRFRIARVQPKAGTNIVNPTGPTNYFGYNINNFEYVPNNFAYTFDITNTSSINIISGGWYFVELATPQPYLAVGGTATLNVSFDIDHSAFQLVTGSKKGGGIRIKEVLFTDEGVQQKKVEYRYNDFPFETLIDVINNRSSGSFEVNPNTRSYIKGKTHPFFTAMQCVTNINYVGEAIITGYVSRQPQTVNYEVVRDISAIYTPNTKGNYVGYKHVLKTESGNGSELLTYISPRDVEIQTGEFTLYPFKPQENLDYKRGKLQNRKVYLEKEPLEITPKVLQEEIYDYQDISNVVRTSIFPYEAKSFDCPWDSFFNTYAHYSSSNPLIVDNPSQFCIDDTMDNDISSCYGAGADMTFTDYDLRKGVLLPKEIIKRQFFYDGNTLSHTIESTDNMSYNDKNRIEQQTTEIDESGTTVILKQEMFYPYSEPYNEFTLQERTVFDLMEGKNIIETAVYTESRRDTALIGKTKTIFDQVTIDNFQPINVKVYKGHETQGNEINFISYDTFGNLQEVNKKDGTSVVYIWGYDSKFPIAKIENSTYAGVENAIDAIPNDSESLISIQNYSKASQVLSYNENTFRAKLDKIRQQLPNAMVTTFTYDSLVGVTSITDPRGETIYYYYDAFSRLELVKDKDGNILSENQYNYKN